MKKPMMDPKRKRVDRSELRAAILRLKPGGRPVECPADMRWTNLRVFVLNVNRKHARDYRVRKCDDGKLRVLPPTITSSRAADIRAGKALLAKFRRKGGAK